MKIDLSEVEKTAELAGLKLLEAEKEAMVNQLNAILEAFSSLQELNTEEIQPFIFSFRKPRALRKDQVSRSLSAEAITKNAPSRDENFFKVPPVLDSFSQNASTEVKK